MISSKDNNVKFNSSYLTEGKIESREFQINIAEKCLNKDSLVVIPTGMGKTVIAALIAAKTLEIFPLNSKIIMLAPTRPLIVQHYNKFVEYLKLPIEKQKILTGRVVPEKRSKFFEDNQILFYTPQTLRNDLVNQKYDLKRVCLIIFDEAHHATGDYAYITIAEKFKDQNPDGFVLALTASPGATKKKITQLCKNLRIPINKDNIHIRDREDEDVKKYIKPMSIYKVGAELSPLMEAVFNGFKNCLNQRLKYLSQTNYLNIHGDNLYEKVIRKDLIRLSQTLQTIINGDGDKTGAFAATSINAQAMILFHMIELVEQQGLDVLLEYLDKLHTDSKKKTSSKAVQRLAIDSQLNLIYKKLNEERKISSNNLVHPKFSLLVKVINDELDYNPKSRILVFVKLRDSVRIISERFESYDRIKPARFVGQAHKSKKDKGLSQKKQIEILDQFKSGKFNVLVSTNVGEEGLDIAECDLVVFYDIVTSEIRMIQRRGRTARHREGKVIILYTSNTNDETYLRIAMAKLKKMRINLKNPEELEKYYLEDVNKEEKESNTKSKEVGTYQKQYDLSVFIDNVRKKEFVEKLKCRKEQKIDIILSNKVSMKYGVRKNLKENNIRFQVRNSKFHIVMFNKVLIQIYKPKDMDLEKIYKEYLEFEEQFELVLIIYDFIDFGLYESYEGEMRFLKNKILDFNENHEIEIISIHNSEELSFIIKDVYENKKV